MFQKKATSTELNRKRSDSEPVPRTQTVIGPGVRVEGDLKSGSGVELHGTVEGRFEISGPLIVGESGHIKGNVTARDVIVRGAVEGHVVAAGRIEIGPRGRIQGNLRAQAVSIADGAQFQGKVEMTMSPESAPRKDVSIPAEAAV